jgi:phage shock protein PspC (stress-responsive transcriptional regulator)
MTDTRMCPYCAEEIRAAAIRCKHCGSFLSPRSAPSDWYRSSSDRMIAGVCGGLARQFGVPAAVIRLAFVLMTLFSGGVVGIVIYVVLWIVMPSDVWSEEELEPRRLPERSDP